MTINNNIRNNKLQYDINREGAKISAFSSGKIHKYLTVKEVLPPAPSRMIKQAKLTYPPLGKPLQKQMKIIEYERKKQVETLKNSETLEVFLQN